MRCLLAAGDSFFPGTGDSSDIGVGAGKYYAVNVPLRDGMDDASYKFLFDPIITKIMENYQPGAVVLQSPSTNAELTEMDQYVCFEGCHTTNMRNTMLYCGWASRSSACQHAQHDAVDRQKQCLPRCTTRCCGQANAVIFHCSMGLPRCSGSQ
eukprot:scaffold220180_cov21-Tisochrysis_lutea.AAC.1